MVSPRLSNSYTLTKWNGVTHLSDRYARETLCGISKVNRPEVASSDGDGCRACANEHVARRARTAVAQIQEFLGE
jgi:hypothetical protein